MWQTISYYAVLALESVVGVFGIRLYEEPRYDVIDRLADQVEIRRYGPRLAAEVEIAGMGEAGRSEAFQLLLPISPAPTARRRREATGSP